MRCGRVGSISQTLAAVVAACWPLQGCGVNLRPMSDAPSARSGFVGGAVADEPRAVLVARDVLAQGGSAADAAVALGFALSVTLPSRAGLGAEGACLSYSPDEIGVGFDDGLGGATVGVPGAVLFLSPPPVQRESYADRPAGVPMLARGLFALHARAGTLHLEQLIAPAERLARFGTPTARALARDLAVVAGPLETDRGMAAIFAPHGQLLREGAMLRQPDLGTTLAALRVAGVGDLYQGSLSGRVVIAADRAGGGLSRDALRAAVPQERSALVLPAGRDRIAFLPPPADGGLAAAASFAALQQQPADPASAKLHGLAAVARWRQQGGDPQVLAEDPTDPPASLGALPASTSFATLDQQGRAVVCAVSMNNLFGTGRLATGTGIVLAATPQPRPLLAGAIVWNAHLKAFRAAIGGSGQDGAGLAVAAAAQAVLHDGALPRLVPGRSTVLQCPGYLPGDAAGCRWRPDSHNAGLTLSGD